MTPDLVADFCRFHHAFHQISEDRAVAQGRLLRRLEEFLGEKPITEMTSGNLEMFLLSRNTAPSTTNKHLKMVLPFCKWLYRNQHITAEQLMDLREVKPPRGSGQSAPRPYSRSEINTFWRRFDQSFPWTRDKDPFDRTPKRGEYWVQRYQESPDAFEWYQVRPYAVRLQAEAIVTIALYGGLRRMEIYDLTLADMDYEAAYLRVLGAAKNERAERIERAVPMTSVMRTAISNWLEFRVQVLKPEHDRPWLTLWRLQRLEPMAFSVLAHLLQNVGDGYELHRMRHTFATERLRSKMPVETLQKIMGHSNIAMTLRYARIGTEDILRVAGETNEQFEANMAGDEER